MVSLIEDNVPKELGDWIYWAQDRYPEEESLSGAYISWRFRFSTNEEVCEESRSCLHLLCVAVTEACDQRFSNDIQENPYRSRIYVMDALSQNKLPNKGLVDSVPVRLKNGIQGDLAISDGRYVDAFRLYQISNGL